MVKRSGLMFTMFPLCSLTLELSGGAAVRLNEMLGITPQREIRIRHLLRLGSPPPINCRNRDRMMEVETGYVYSVQYCFQAIQVRPSVLFLRCLEPGCYNRMVAAPRPPSFA